MLKMVPDLTEGAEEVRLHAPRICPPPSPPRHPGPPLIHGLPRRTGKGETPKWMEITGKGKLFLGGLRVDLISVVVLAGLIPVFLAG